MLRCNSLFMLDSIPTGSHELKSVRHVSSAFILGVEDMQTGSLCRRE